MADSAGPYSRPPSSAAAHVAQPSLHSPSPRPSVASRGSRSSLRRQAAIAAGSASASASASIQQQQQLQIPLPPAEPSTPNFTQLFTTVTSTTHPSNKSTTHHPTVHYIFADDDPDILTEALAHHHRTAEAEEQPDEDHPEEHPPTERAVVLDIVPSPSAPAGYEVAWASSLAPDWAVVSARVGRTDGSGGALQQGSGGGGGGMLTLQIEGVSVERSGPTPSSSRGKLGSSPVEGDGKAGRGSAAGKQQNPEHQPSEEYPALMDEFDQRMDVLRRVVEAAEVRRRTMEAAARGDDGEEEEEETQRPEEVTQRPPDDGDGASAADPAKGKERAHSTEDEEDEAGPTTG